MQWIVIVTPSLARIFQWSFENLGWRENHPLLGSSLKAKAQELAAFIVRESKTSRIHRVTVLAETGMALQLKSALASLHPAIPFVCIPHDESVVADQSSNEIQRGP